MYLKKLDIEPVVQQEREGRRTEARLFSDVLRGALGGDEDTGGSSQIGLLARRGCEGALGKDADTLVSLQRQALSLSAGGAEAWDALLALSLTKARFTGRDSMKVEREEEDMIVVM
jgi:hypothetical protein